MMYWDNTHICAMYASQAKQSAIDVRELMTPLKEPLQSLSILHKHFRIGAMKRLYGCSINKCFAISSVRAAGFITPSQTKHYLLSLLVALAFSEFVFFVCSASFRCRLSPISLSLRFFFAFARTKCRLHNFTLNLKIISHEHSIALWSRRQLDESRVIHADDTDVFLSPQTVKFALIFNTGTRLLSH